MVIAAASVPCVQFGAATTAQNAVLVSMMPRSSDLFPVWGGVLLQFLAVIRLGSVETRLGLSCKLKVFDRSEGLALRDLLARPLHGNLLLFGAALGRSSAVVLVEGHFLIQINKMI